MIRTVGLSRRFGDRLAVENLDLEVSAGEVLGFLGPNGAGKTTTVRLLCGLIAASEGYAEIAGFRVDQQPDEVRARVGILTETPGLYERLSTRENLRLFAELYGVDRPAARIQHWLTELELWDRRDDAAGSLSKGMRQRLAIARAMLHDPPVLFLDEPTSGLDPESARRVRETIASLKSEGRTIFLCTHNLDEAERLCDRVAVFKNRLLALDSAQALKRAAFGREVVFHLSKVEATYLDAVRAVPGVMDVSTKEQQISVRLVDPDVVNPGVVRALVVAGAEVRFIGETKHSLEEIYLQLVGDP